VKTTPEQIFDSLEQKKEFDKFVQDLLPENVEALTQQEPELEGKTREELLLMLPPELRAMIAPVKGWQRTTARMRKLMKKEPKYLFKNTGNKSFARKEKESK